MEIEYFNYSTIVAETRWERSSFIRNWRKIGAADRRWVPPAWSALKILRRIEHEPALVRQKPLVIHLEALSRVERKNSSELATGAFESPVAASIILRNDQARTAYLSWLHIVNDEDTLYRYLGIVHEALWRTGIQRLVVSTGLSPYLGSGILLDHFHLDPPLYSPYNPPYYPELLQTSMKLTKRSQLLTFSVDEANPVEGTPEGPAELAPFPPRRLAHGLLDLLVASCEELPLPAPNYDDAALMIRQLGPWPLYGWLARIDRQPVGFILLQADGAEAQRFAKGGSNALGRTWMRWRKERPFPSGRVLFAGVLPQWRGQGIGTQLVDHAYRTARRLGWQMLTAGPLPNESAGSLFLQKRGGRPQQNYGLYEMEL